MGYIHCCAGLRNSKQYMLRPDDDSVLAQLDYLEECPVCGHTVLQITKINCENKVSVCRKVNLKAKRLFEKLKSSIVSERKVEFTYGKYHSNFYLHYNEYGVKKKCYSNLSSLKMGLFENRNMQLASKV